MAPPLHKAIQKPARFAELVDAYVNACLIRDDAGKDTLITMAGLALHLGCDKDSLLNWVDRYAEATEHDPQCLIFGALKKAKAASEQQLEQECYRNKNAMALALGKCMYGWVEQQHVKVNHTGGVQVVVASAIPQPKAD